MRKRSSVQHYVETCGFKIRLMLHNIIQCTDIQWWHMSLHTVQSELSTKKTGSDINCISTAFYLEHISQHRTSHAANGV